MSFDVIAKRVDFWLSIVLLVLFFLPWLSIDNYRLVHGYHLVQSIFEGWADALPGVYLVLLVPIGILGTLVTCILGTGGRYFALVSGIGVVVTVGILIAEAGKDAGLAVEPGGWLSLVVGLLLCVSVFVRRPAASAR